MALVLAMWAINIWMAKERYHFFSDQVAVAFGGTVVSILIWSVIGYVMAGFYSFFHNLIRPDEGNLTLWQKANLGLLAGIIMKPWFGIVF